jgi:transketolase
VLPVSDRPVAMVLTRQNLPTVDRDQYGSATGVARGGYVLSDPAGGEPEVILIGTGSEVAVCLDASDKLTADGVRVRVVSMPCWELFDEQDQAYRDSVLPPAVTARVAVEAGVRQGWDRYLGSAGRFVGMASFGASAPFQELYEHFGITGDNVARVAKETLGR